MDPVVAYLVVASASFLITLAELVLRFGGGIWSALRTSWAWLLVVVNVLFALLVFAIAVTELRVAPGLISGLLFGMFAPAILRSRFTFFRAGSKEDVNAASISLPLERIYTDLQEKCYHEVDGREAGRRAVRANALAEKWPEEKLKSAMEKIVAGRQIVDERQRDEKFLKEILKVSDESMRRYRLAMFLIDIAGGNEDQLLA